jgi:hypothetical protein
MNYGGKASGLGRLSLSARLNMRAMRINSPQATAMVPVDPARVAALNEPRNR